VNHPGNEKEILKQLSDSYLYKDILLTGQIKKPEALVKLLQALAFQVGSQVSYHELAQVCGLDGKTIEKYMMLLEQSYIIFRLTSFSRNLRNELKKSRKIYFYDNGIRNALIANFNQIENRTDIGALWENYLVSERVKYLAYQQKWVNHWYWRTTEQQEIDYLEEENGKLTAYEFKWNPTAKVSIPNAFKQTYPLAEINIIHRENFYEFLVG
jgi:predicted AAA+ superfamily ATPase